METEKEQPQEERFVKLTGLPISDRMKEILARLEQGDVALDEIKDTPEMNIAG
ncbi:MAG: hypothetical protein LUI12_10045 [Clostridiales bacterium]|nr:hypothetical protein [Clostridiales bacterium]